MVFIVEHIGATFETKVGVRIGVTDGIESFYLIVDNLTSLHAHSHPIYMSIILLDKVFTIDLKATQLTIF